MIDISGLTVAQKQAVLHNGGSILVSAAAGSGKTKVLVDRLIMRLLDEGNPHDITEYLIITYTKAAASELKDKIAVRLREMYTEYPKDKRITRQLSRLNLAQISTVHSFCSALLKEYAWVLNIPGDFRIADDGEAALLKRKTLNALLNDQYSTMSQDFKTLISEFSSKRNDSAIGDIVLTLYEQANARVQPEKWLNRCVSLLEHDQYDDFSDTPWGIFLIERCKQECKDISEMLKVLIEELNSDPVLSECYAPLFLDDLNRFSSILNAKKWDEIAQLLKTDVLSAKRIKKGADEELKCKAKLLRDLYKPVLKKYSTIFDRSSCQALEELKKIQPSVRAAVSLAVQFKANYEKEKQSLRIMDYSDLEHNTLKLLYDKTFQYKSAAASDITSKYSEVFVDEYQDSNEIQDMIFSAVTQMRKNLFVVGDVKQSIYGFRLADPTIFLKYYHSFRDIRDINEKNEDSGVPVRICLSDNFRSRPEVLSAANDVFRRSMTVRTGGLHYGDSESLHPKGIFKDVPYLPVELHILSTDTSDDENENTDSTTASSKTDIEAEFVAERIHKMLTDKVQVSDHGDLREIKAGDIAILLRSPKSEGPAFSKSLSKYGIGTFSESSENIMRSAEIETYIAWLEMLNNPHNDISTVAVMLSPLYGFTPDELAEIRASSRVNDFFESVKNFNSPEQTDLSLKVSHFIDSFHALRKISSRDGYPVAFEKMLYSTNEEGIYGTYPDGQSKSANTEYFKEYLYKEFANGNSLSKICESLRLLQDKGVQMTSQPVTDAVLITSIHKSKGLEYPVVVLPSLSKRFNEEDLNGKFLFDSSLGIVSNIVDLSKRITYPSVIKKAVIEKKRDEILSEELRVLYVAMTRPKDILIMTYCGSRIENKLKKLSAISEAYSNEYSSSNAASLGDWILTEALHRKEAQSLRAAAEISPLIQTSESQWLITYTEGCNSSKPLTEEMQKEKPVISHLNDISDDDILRNMAFEYPYLNLNLIPAKLSVTQIKGRKIDHEIEENSAVPDRNDQVHFKETVSSILEKKATASERGTALHEVMQYIAFRYYSSLDEIKKEISRLLEEGFISQKTFNIADPKIFLTFFNSELAKRVINCPQIERELKFSIMLPASKWYPEIKDENIFVQGVADCCLFENNSITVIDFKSDHIFGNEDEKLKAEKYRNQVELYAEALSKIYNVSVRDKIIYFFETGKTVFL